MLPVLDDLKRTVDHARQAGEKNDAALLQGIEMVLDKFNRTLATAGVKPIESVGKPFDPLLHEALMSRPVEDQEAGVILEEFETGYIYHDRVIRHAKVVVSA
jgi:molecular chaperone GrpE